MPHTLAAIAAILALAGSASAAPLTAADILAQSPASAWRALDPNDTLYMDLPQGRVVIELAPAFAPNHAANIRALVHSGYFDDSAIVRVQDNYVVQWSAPESRKITAGHDTLKAEFDKPIGPRTKGEPPFVPLADPDTYASEVGFSGDFPAARDPKTHTTWLAHCYGMVGAGRDNDADSGGGKELYAVIGQSPRNLDRNVTLVGRVVQGMELLSALPRGPGDMGFYAKDADKTAIRKVRLAADLPVAERLALQVLKTDSPTFKALIEARRTRHDTWYRYSPERLGLCNIQVPVRVEK